MLSSEDIDRVCARGESLEVEFKRKLSDKELVENVVCLANGEGGLLLVGVEDDGQVTGAAHRHETRTDPTRLRAMVSNRTRPSVSPEVEIVAHPDGEVLAIRVPRSKVAVATTDGRYLRRTLDGRGEPECVPFFVYDMGSQQQGVVGDYSLVPVPEATWDDLEPLEFDRLRRFVREEHGDQALLRLSNDELARALDAVESDDGVERIRVLGLLLFGTEDALRRFVPTHEVAFQELRGTEVGINEFYRLPLLRVFEEVTN